MVEDDLDFSKSHWDDALSNSSIHESLGPDNQSKGDADDRNEELNDSEVSSEPLKSTDNNTTQSPNLPASRQKHHRITTLRSSRFNKKVAPKVHIEAVSSSNPLGPLGAATAETDSSSTSRTRSFGDKTVLSGINHYNANNERLALFGDDKVESPNNLSSGRSEVSSSIGTKGTTNEDSFDTSGSSHFKDLSLNDGGNNPQSLTDSNATKQIDPSRFDPSSTTQTGPQLNTFEITVGDPIKVGDITSAHIVYTVHTKTNSPNFSSVETSVTRRYKDFRWLYHALENNNPGIIIPPPPEKQAVGRFDEDFVESRRAALENMLNKCANHNSLQSDPDFRIFLESETFSTDIKSKQYQSQTSSVSNGSESKGFMGSLGGAFSFSGKFVETDEWFLEKKTYVDSLESQFKYLEKSLDAVVAQRKELSDATAEFANILGSLSQVELSKSFGELVERFSQVELRVRDLYYRQCMQDILSLGTTLEEYIRLISSIRNVFAHRQKAYFTMQVAEQDLYKKRNHLEKVMKQGKTLQDKIAVLKQDVSDQEKKVINLRVAFDDISKLIISEFARFEASKAHDFRNSVELYLENAVEAQKEAIEIWETFYQLSGFVPAN